MQGYIHKLFDTLVVPNETNAQLVISTRCKIILRVYQKDRSLKVKDNYWQQFVQSGTFQSEISIVYVMSAFPVAIKIYMLEGLSHGSSSPKHRTTVRNKKKKKLPPIVDNQNILPPSTIKTSSHIRQPKHHRNESFLLVSSCLAKYFKSCYKTMKADW